ncbi:MAG TPA: peptidyl-alpha-hydroxyglycine alpha-amidating lyase family protein [Bryobacteraceae bacterium]|nr:peptidyl-alpha-hydroxyglycine alpha-amidating lyase family protein [Bryobacteraceae bacterium]
MKQISTFLPIAVLFAGSVAAQTPEIAFDSAPNLLKFPEHIALGEAAGVATNSKGNLYVYTRTGGTFATVGASRTFTHAGSRLFEFAPGGKFVREIGVGVYGFLFAQAVRVDPQDNIWIVDRGSNMVIKFAPDGRVLMTLSRKPESVVLTSPGAGPGRGAGREGGAAPAGRQGGGGARGGGGAPGAGIPGDSFNKPTDVAWDSAGNIFVSDGYGNSRIAKFDKGGKFVKSWGSKGTEPGQFDMPNSLAVDSQGNVYVADLGNKRIQVFDNEGTFKAQISNVGSPWAICISPGSHPFLFASDSNDPRNLDNGEIYKMELDGKIVGKFGKAGKQMKEFGTVNEIDCRNPNELYVGEVGNWRVQKLSLH